MVRFIAQVLAAVAVDQAVKAGFQLWSNRKNQNLAASQSANASQTAQSAQ